MGATLQNFVNKHVWDFEKRSTTSSDMSIGGRFWDFVKGSGGFQSVSVRDAQMIAAVYTALSVRSQTIASLPINVYTELPNGDKKNRIDHPSYMPLAHEPNDYMSSANLFMTVMLNMDSEGNAYVYIHRNGRREVSSFELWCPTEVSVNLVEGSAFYTYEGETYPARDVLHFRMFSNNGLHGLSPIRMNQSTMGMAKKLDEFSGMSIGEKPPGILGYEGDLTPEQRAQNQIAWEKDRKAGKTPIMSGKWKYTPVMISPGDAEYLGSRKLNKTDIWGIWKIPPIFAQDYERATFANAEQSDLIYAKHTITPIVKVFEQEINMKCFTEAEKLTTYVKFNMNGLLRGDMKSRAEFYTVMRNAGGMDGNEMRSLEDMNTYIGGDIKTLQVQNIPVDMMRKYWESKSTVKETAPAGTQRDAYEEQPVLN